MGDPKKNKREKQKKKKKKRPQEKERKEKKDRSSVTFYWRSTSGETFSGCLTKKEKGWYQLRHETKVRHNFPIGPPPTKGKITSDGVGPRSPSKMKHLFRANGGFKFRSPMEGESTQLIMKKRSIKKKKKN